MKLLFNDKEYVIKIDNEKIGNIDYKQCLNELNNLELFNYLYNYHKDLFDEINSDPYYDGKTIKSGEDLKNSIEEIKLVTSKNGIVYICGEYWCDPEHGFSIAFPGGKFIKSKYDTFDFHRDVGREVKYIPVCTLLGHYSDYL